MTDATKSQAGHLHCARCGRCGRGTGKLHELKAWPFNFSAILGGHMQFELRKDDRGFAVGDTLLLREWDPETQQYSGREIFKRVNYIRRSGLGVEEGYVIMGIQPS